MNALVVGGGLAGLACALKLQSTGHEVRILESSDQPGGRVRTDLSEGFLLDRGFQVYLDAYPNAGGLLDLKALDLRKFNPGALVFTKGKLHLVADPFRQPSGLFKSLLAPVGSLADKLRVGLLRGKVLNRQGLGEETSTEQMLVNFGFSKPMINVFFRSFYGGIFLERELITSSKMFEFTFRMFSQGNATVPASGMQQIPLQLAARLAPETISYFSRVSRVESDRVQLSTGEQLEADAVVVATDVSTARKLVPDLPVSEPNWRSVTNLYFGAERSPINAPTIALNGSGKGLVNNVCVLSDVAPEYAPKGQHLVSVSVLGVVDDPQLSDKILIELAAWFGDETKTWRHLRTDHIEQGLPEQLLVRDKPTLFHRGIHFCGDYLGGASIEGAVLSGLKTADQIISQAR